MRIHPQTFERGLGCCFVVQPMYWSASGKDVEKSQTWKWQKDAWAAWEKSLGQSWKKENVEWSWQKK